MTSGEAVEQMCGREAAGENSYCSSDDTGAGQAHSLPYRVRPNEKQHRYHFMKVAAYQAPLRSITSPDVIDQIRVQIDWCEANRVDVLCCPEAVLGGLADYVTHPGGIALSVERGHLRDRTRPLQSDTVVTIIGFTEIDREGRLYNSAAVLHAGSILGTYRKLHPAINRSVYVAGTHLPVFRIRDATFGIVICRDSNYRDPVRTLARKGIGVLFVPTNNGLSAAKASRAVVTDARETDAARAIENDIFVVRADVAGEAASFISYGSTGITGPDGTLIASGPELQAGLVVAEISRDHPGRCQASFVLMPA